MINNFKDLQKLLPNINTNIKQVINKYGIQIPSHYLSLINLNNPNDPLYKAVIPSIKELREKPDELSDPIGDQSDEFKTLKTSMLIHRYPDRVLLLTTNKCAGRCRYCFRKSSIFNKEEIFSKSELTKSLQYIKNTKTINEVILSGGDPLYMPRNDFQYIFKYIIKNCPHIKAIRIHSRAPIYNPNILTTDLIKFLNTTNKKLPIVFIFHIIHSREVCEKFTNKVKQLNCIKLCQSVLLKGINDTTKELKNLSWALINAGIIPHYLHYLDKAKGISHFRITLDKARDLLAHLQGHLSGHLIPKLILDVPNGMGKIILNKSFIIKEDRKNKQHKLTIKSTHSNKITIYKEQR